jgi:hypothetical protein
VENALGDAGALDHGERALRHLERARIACD